MKKHSKSKRVRAARSAHPRRSGSRVYKAHKARKVLRKLHKVARRKPSHSRVAKKSKISHAIRQARRPRRPQPVAALPQKAAAEVPTLEQVTITCANCGRPFKVFKLKGLSLEGTICQRCSLGEVELPESFG